jgi:enoyl-[acyl-carrier protein] reductase III
MAATLDWALMDSVDRVALVTGSGRGIGRAIALRLARDGYHLVINYLRHRTAADETADEVRRLGRHALVFKANVGELDQLAALFSATDQEYGRLDVLVNNAASGYNRPVMEQKPRGWEWTFNINARSALFGAQHAVPLMTRNGGGCIVNVTSMGSQRVLPDYVVVGASKAALEALTRYLAVELAVHHISVNAVSPGMAATEALLHFRDLVQDLDETVNRVTAETPAGRLVTPDDVANVVAFLCTPEATMIRGQVIVVDGGYTLGHRIDHGTKNGWQ